MTPLLRELQREFAAAIFRDDTAVLRHFRDGVFPAARHLQVYRHNTFANLTDALAAVYPVVHRLVDEGFFEYAADGFIRLCPPRSGNLHDFGAAFGDFLAAFPSARSLPYLPDVARLEWAWHEAFHAPDAPPLPLAALAAVPPDRYPALAFRMHPSTRLLVSEYPVLHIWQVNQPDFDGDPTVSLEEGPQRMLVVRCGLSVAIEPLGVGEYALLRAFADARTLAQANHAALRVDATFDLTQALQRHVALGTLVQFTESPGKE